MFQTTELILHMDTEILNRHMSTLMPVSLIFFGWYGATFFLARFLPYLIILLMRIFLASMIVLMLIGAIYTLFELSKEGPFAVLNKDGIWLRHFGFISWCDVEKFDVFVAPGSPVEFVGIRCKDLAKLSAQSSVTGKLSIFWSRFTGYPPITLSNLTKTPHEIVHYARLFSPSLEKNNVADIVNKSY